ncbi:hypothetical protein NMD69_15135 [Edwardsiella tarda]|uniref:hypothetical protein n=1 Tax=Edwardsiella tarda TaxID=636 RepID=UPI00351C9D55
MIIKKKYVLVDATARKIVDLRYFTQEIECAAQMSFGGDLIDVTINESNFIIQINSIDGKIKHGVLVNFGKNISRQVTNLCSYAMKVYISEKYPVSRQLFKSI